MRRLCKNCKYFFYSSWEFGPERIRCKHPSFIVATECHPYLGMVKAWHPDSYDVTKINERCDCNIYKRQWYKFWVRDDK